MGQCYLFTSGKGGTGKSTAVSVIASCLAVLGKRVLCIDMDLRLPNLDLILGLSDLSTADIADVAQGRYPLLEAALEHPEIPGLFLLPGPAFYDDTLDQAMLSKIVQDGKTHFDYVIIDGPAGLDELFYATARAADAVVVVASTDASSQRDAQRAVMELDQIGIENIHMILNRVRLNLIRRTTINADDIIDFIGAPILGIVPEDQDVLAAAIRLKPLVLYSRQKAAASFLNIAKRMLGEQVPLEYR